MAYRETQGHDFIKRNFSAIWPVHVEAFTRLLTLLRCHFDGDLDLMLVLAVIGGRTLPDNWVSELDMLEHVTRLGEQRSLPTAINLQSIADYTGIPRETVRRKLAVLLDKGWITKDEKGFLSATGDAAADLASATGASIQYLATLLNVFEAAGNQRE